MKKISITQAMLLVALGLSISGCSTRPTLASVPDSTEHPINTPEQAQKIQNQYGAGK